MAAKSSTDERIKELEDKNAELMKLAVAQAREIDEAHAKIGGLVLQNERQQGMIAALQNGIQLPTEITAGAEEGGQ